MATLTSHHQSTEVRRQDIAVYRDRITQYATDQRRRDLTVTDDQIARAVSLAIGWADLAATHGADRSILDGVSDLATTALDTIKSIDRRTGRPHA